jgi:prevent-host-death family protein
MKILDIRELKTKLSQVVAQLPKEGSVIITKNGQPRAVLMPFTGDTDLELVALSQNRRFWQLFDDAVARADSEGWRSSENH